MGRLLLGCGVLTLAIGCASVRSLPKGPIGRFEDSMVYAPTRYPRGNWQPVNLDVEDVWFTAADGTRLHGWYCPRENARAVVLYLHGNAGNLSDRAEVVRMLHDRFDLSVMIFDYRGFGRSEGSPDEIGILADARAARAWLAAREGIGQGEIVLMGRSLGGGVATDLAAADGARALILQNTFTSLPDVASRHIAWLPTRLLMRNRFNSLAKIGRYHGPLLCSHGDVDRMIPYEQGQRLFEAANEPKRFVAITGAGHNDPETPEYYQALDAFLAQLPPSRGVGTLDAPGRKAALR